MSSVRRILYPGRQYLLRDEFNDDRAAGALNGVTMPATPGPGNRTGVDTESKLSISGGQLVCAGGNVVPGWGNPGLQYAAVTRIAGRTLLLQTTWIGGANYHYWGFSTGTTGSLNDAGMSISNAGGLRILANTEVIVGTSPSSNTSIKSALVLRTIGVYYFIKGGAFTSWTLLGIDASFANSSIYPRIINYNTAFTVDYIRKPARLWLPPVLAHDTFTRGNGVIGSTEAAGPDNQGAPILAWTGATWTIATNKAINTPVAGSEKVSNGEFTTVTTGWTPGNCTLTQVDSTADPGAASGGADNGAAKQVATGSSSIYQALTLVVGTWYQFTCRAYAPSANDKVKAARLQPTNLTPAITSQVTAEDAWQTLLQTARATNTSVSYILQCQAAGASTVGDIAYFDMATVKPLTLSELFASLQDVGTPDVVVDATLAAYTTGTQMGIVARLDSAAVPANFIHAYQADANVVIAECVAGVYTNLASVASAFATSDVLRLDLSGANYRLYKITSAGVATLLSASTTTRLVGNLHGMFDTLAGAGNAFSKFTVMQKAGYSIPE